jgi:hypothetical protein
MKPEKLVQHLTDAVKKTGFRIRIEEGNFRGGSCIFAEERLVILNRRMTQEERAEILGRVMASEDLDSIFLLPEIRSFIEKFMTSGESDTTQTNPEESEVPPETPSANDENAVP